MLIYLRGINNFSLADAKSLYDLRVGLRKIQRILQDVVRGFKNTEAGTRGSIAVLPPDRSEEQEI